MDLMDLRQRVQQVIQVRQFRGTDLLVQIPAQHGAGIDHVVRNGGGGSIGHFGGNAVVLSFNAGQALVESVDLRFEDHDVGALRQLVADVLRQARFDDFRELGLVHDQDVTQIALFGAGGVDRVADNLGRDDIQLDVELVLDDLVAGPVIGIPL